MIHDPDEALQHELADFPRCRLEICRPAEYVSAPARPSQGLQPIESEPIIFPSATSLHHGAEQSLIMTATFY